MRFIHTADWQIGKSFRRFGGQEAVLRQARLEAIEEIGRLAVRQEAGHVLVAGDVFDNEAPAPQTLLEPLERMRAFPAVRWHMLPGNHDPHRPKGVWDRVRDAGLPANVQLHLTPEPYALDAATVLLPAPLTRKSERADLSEWMDSAESAPGALRIGMAHGSVVGFSSEGEAGNPIDPARPARAGLSYLALGDWHRTNRIGPRLWYAGTPEPDRAGSQEQGQALLVDIPGPGADPTVTPHVVGRFTWLSREEKLGEPGDLDLVDSRLRALPALSSTILRLSLTGSLPIAGRAELERRLLRLAAAVFRLDADYSELQVRPTVEDLEAIDFGGVLRQAADRLQALVDDASLDLARRRQAQEALVQLYLTVVSDPANP